MNATVLPFKRPEQLKPAGFKNAAHKTDLDIFWHLLYMTELLSASHDNDINYFKNRRTLLILCGARLYQDDKDFFQSDNAYRLAMLHWHYLPAEWQNKIADYVRGL